MSDLARSLGQRLWRRPLSEDEIARLSGVGDAIGREARDFWIGARYMIAAMLQSPHFLFRKEIGQQGDAPRALDAWEIASRMSFLLWNGPPDEELARAAAASELLDPSARRAQAERMLGDDRARRGVRALFEDVYDLDGLRDHAKDPFVFARYDVRMAEWGRTQTLLTIEDIVIDRRADIRDLITSRRTFVNRKLASLYGVPATARDEEFGAVELPYGQRAARPARPRLVPEPERAPHLQFGHAARQVRARAPAVPDHPPTRLRAWTPRSPEASSHAPTLRDRVATHLEVAQCAGCHTLMDPMGLALENFDGIGAWRDQDNGHPIDASGILDGASFSGPSQLAEVIRDHGNLGPCFVQHALRHATSQDPSTIDRETIDELTHDLVDSGWRFDRLLVELIAHPIFILANDPIAPQGHE